MERSTLRTKAGKEAVTHLELDEITLFQIKELFEEWDQLDAKKAALNDRICLQGSRYYQEVPRVIIFTRQGNDNSPGPFFGVF